MTITALPTAWASLHAALQARRPVSVTYHRQRRVVCPHALGWKNNRPLVLAFQIGGHTSTGTLPADPRQRWRCMYIDEIENVSPADPANKWQTANNYNHSQPFPTIDNLAIAITPNGQSHHS